MQYSELGKVSTGGIDASSNTAAAAAETSESAPPAKRHCSRLFGHYTCKNSARQGFC